MHRSGAALRADEATGYLDAIIQKVMRLEVAQGNPRLVGPPAKLTQFSCQHVGQPRLARPTKSLKGKLISVIGPLQAAE